MMMMMMITISNVLSEKKRKLDKYDYWLVSFAMSQSTRLTFFG